MTNKTEALREKIAKIQRCYRNCRIYPTLCKKFRRCKVAIDDEDYAWADQILQACKEAGMVMLAEDQSLPNKKYSSGLDAKYKQGLSDGYGDCLEDMLKANFRKIEGEG